jgi:hypothetical protein
MNKAPFYLLLSFLFLSCKKDVVEVVVIKPAPFTVQLKVEQVINDSTILLQWSRYTDTFQKYLLVRSAVYLKNGQFINFYEPVDSSNDINHLNFTENKMPLASDVYYDLYVSRDTTLPSRGYRQVARVRYQRPNSLLFGSPVDVLIDKRHQRLFITEQNRITVMGYNGTIITSKEFTAGLGFCSLDTSSGNNELYVPGDGWLQILDGTTLQLKDRIYVAGYRIGSVVALNGILYVSSTDMSAGGYSNCVKVYDRATKTLIGRTGYWDGTRLIALEGSAVELIDISINLIPVSLSYYQFSATGVPLIKKEDTYHGDYSMNPSIVRSFPDGSKFITSSSGTIFNKSLFFDRYVKQYGSYSDFAFNDDGSRIYAAYASQKKIDIVTYPTTTTLNSYITAWYPYKIFRDGNTLISISKSTANVQYGYVFIEKINL